MPILVKYFCTLFFAILLLATNTASAQDTKLHFLRPAANEVSGNSKLIIFVHGIVSNSKDAWKNPKNALSWPEMVQKDPVFDNADIAIFDYPSSFYRSGLGSINQLADQLEARLEAKVVNRYSDVVFVAHSMGGLIVRSVVQKMDNATNSTLLFFLAVPTGGSKIATYANRIGLNSETIKGLKLIEDGNLFLESEISNWESLLKRHDIRSNCFYEKVKTYGKIIVPQSSATWLCNEKAIPIFENHEKIAKPVDFDALIHERLRYSYTNQYGISLMNFSGYPRTQLSSSTPMKSKFIVAEEVKLISDVKLLPNTFLVTRQLDLNGHTLTAPDSIIITLNLLDGTIKASGNNGNETNIDGEKGATLTVVAGQLSGAKIVSRGGNGANGKDGQDGEDGRPGSNGQKGNCDGFGSFRSPRPGSDGRPGEDGIDGGNGGNGNDGGEVFFATLQSPELIDIDLTAGKGGQGGRGGKGGRGGQGGIGGRGCIGLGGSKSNASDGRTGSAGRDGRNGLSGVPGVQGDVWVAKLGTMDQIAKLLPEPEEIPYYLDTLVPKIHALIKRSKR